MKRKDAILFLILISIICILISSCSRTHTLYYEDGRIKYEGGWKNNLENGEGKYYDRDGTLVYEGEWENGKYHGKGKLYLEYDTIYNGEFINGEMNGTGEIIISGKRKFDGIFEQGQLINGNEYDIQTQEIIYKGYFLNFKYHGKGELFHNGELVYSGTFKNGKAMERTQLFIQRDELTGSGPYKPETIDGYILYSFENGQKSNKIEFYSNEDLLIYEGDIIYVDGKPVIEGYGIAYLINYVSDVHYKSYEGYWKNGLWHGKGKSFWDTGYVFYDTTYKNGYRDGKYVRYYSDGTVNDVGVCKDGENIMSDVYDY